MKNKIEIFQSSNGEIVFNSDIQNETIWANLEQIAKLFARDKSGISRHIKNIFTSEELDKNSVVAIFATTASDGKTYQVEYFNLDMIISIGYRVDSKEATLFRKWATTILKKYLTNGYAINEKKITQTKALLNNLKQTIDFLSSKEIGQSKEVLTLLQNYTKTLSLLESYDKSSIDYFDGASSSDDGNKRSASFMFIYFLDKCDYLYKESGEKKINDNALTTLTLLIASSDPKEKELLIKLIKHLLFEAGDNNEKD